MTTGRRGNRALLAARAAALLCSLIAGFQVLLAAGVPWGRAAWGGGQVELSDVQRVASGGAALLWAAAAVALLAFAGDVASGRLQGSPALRRIAWIIAGISGIGALMNLASPSVWERSIWAPVALATAVLSATAARSLARRPASAVLSPG
jgi:hypothetical protein